MGVGGQRHTPAALPQGKRPGTHCTGGWAGPRAGLDGCGKSHPGGGGRGAQNPPPPPPGGSIPEQVAIPTAPCNVSIHYK